PGVLADAPRRARPSFGLPEGRWPQDRRLVRDAERRRGPVRRRGRGLLQHQHARRAEQLGKRDPMTVKSPLVLLTTLFLVAALGAPQPAAAQTGPIRVGFLTVRTGPLAAGGKQMEEGIQLFLKEHNNTIAGRKVELIIADTGGNPAGARTKTQELVERDKVHVIVGPLAAFEAIAIDDYVRQSRTPIVSCSAAAEDLTQRKPSPWFARTVGTSAQPNHALG